MKKLYRSFLGLLTFASLFIQAKFAFADLCPPGDFTNLCKLDPNKNPNAISNAVGNIVSALIIIAIVVALIYLVYGGIRYISSGGDKAKVDAARSHIRAAIIGLVIALAAFAILNIITYVFLGTSVTKFSLPTLLD